MKPYLFCGDSHGDLEFMHCAAKTAAAKHAEIVCVGDWGFIWPGNNQLQELSDMLVGLGVTCRFIDGNHDDHVTLRKLVGRNRRHGATQIAPHVIYQPRGTVHEDEDGTRFLFLGGAPSIDQASRTPGLSWWPEEQITEPEFCFARSAKGPIHVLVTHDAPDFPPGFTPKGTPRYRRDQEKSMERVNALIRRHRPELAVHGHWHTKYAREVEGTLVEGLDCNTLNPAYLDAATLLWSRNAS